MPGKRTYLHGLHSTNQGELVEDLELTDEDFSPLEEAIGRTLTNEERNSIAENVSMCRHLRQSQLEVIDRQSLKATLSGISTSPAEEIIKRFNDCDYITRAEIDRGLYFLGVRRVQEFDNPTPELVRKAAAAALANLGVNRGGRPEAGYQKLLAEYCVSSWYTYGGKDCAAWAYEHNMAPIVGWSNKLFSLVEKRDFDPSKTAKLLRQKLKTVR